MRTRVKICGITSCQDAEFAVNFGADAIGLVFYADSPRAITIAQAEDIIELLPPFVSVVALFVDAEPEFVHECVGSLAIDLLQFHGDEEETFCAQFNMPYLKAVPMASTSSLEGFCENFETATGFILDSHAQGQMGGSGEKFTWSEIPKKIFIALFID